MLNTTRKCAKTSTESTDRAGWSITSWCLALDISRSFFYLLSREMRPKSMKLGRRHIITEAPAEYVKRIGSQVATPTSAAIGRSA
jgi:hypothetical protein